MMRAFWYQNFHLPTWWRAAQTSKNKMSQLEFICQELGCKVMITTKYHAEYACEGIEYSWGLSKAMYRKFSLSSKKGKQNFDALVSKCISRTVVTKDVEWKFSQRARSYMLTYKSLELEDTEKNIETNNEKISLPSSKLKAWRRSWRVTVRLLILINISSWDQFPRWDLNLKKRSSQMSGREGKEGRESIHNTYIYIPHQKWSREREALFWFSPQ